MKLVIFNSFVVAVLTQGYGMPMAQNLAPAHSAYGSPYGQTPAMVSQFPQFPTMKPQFGFMPQYKNQKQEQQHQNKNDQQQQHNNQEQQQNNQQHQHFQQTKNDQHQQHNNQQQQNNNQQHQHFQQGQQQNQQNQLQNQQFGQFPMIGGNPFAFGNQNPIGLGNYAGYPYSYGMTGAQTFGSPYALYNIPSGNENKILHQGFAGQSSGYGSLPSSSIQPASSAYGSSNEYPEHGKTSNLSHVLSGQHLQGSLPTRPPHHESGSGSTSDPWAAIREATANGVTTKKAENSEKKKNKSDN